MTLAGDGLLTAGERSEFEEKGYFVQRGALGADEGRTYREAMARLFLTPTDHPYASSLTGYDLPPDERDPANPRSLWNGFDLPLFDERFYDLIFHPKLALTVDALIGPDINFYESC